MLHWGVRKGKKEWVLPPESVRPSGSQGAGKIAAETAFKDGETLQLGGDNLNVQRLQLTIPPDAGITGLTFVMRSEDKSAWFRDGRLHSHFFAYRGKRTQPNTP
ncbi:MAG: hypothetical protein EOP48_18705 [Sphingobacteriales bacterium]|nr:MAG: hypothetical protein EOP48_18705 [Sphingobacteriales bacterium]